MEACKRSILDSQESHPAYIELGCGSEIDVYCVEPHGHWDCSLQHIAPSTMADNREEICCGGFRDRYSALKETEQGESLLPGSGHRCLQPSSNHKRELGCVLRRQNKNVERDWRFDDANERLNQPALSLDFMWDSEFITILDSRSMFSVVHTQKHLTCHNDRKMRQSPPPPFWCFVFW